jgi:hypothetical protein
MLWIPAGVYPVISGAGMTFLEVALNIFLIGCLKPDKKNYLNLKWNH